MSLSRPYAVVVALAAVLVALVGGLVLGRGTVADPRVMDAASLGFLRDMSVHHAQAVDMSQVVHRRAEDPAVQTLAFDILTTQQGQIGMMTGWMDLSQVSTTRDGPAMAWMGMATPGPMPGMASAQDLASLETLPVAQMETRFLELMTAHHVGGVEMAEAGAARAESPVVRTLAQGMVDGQGSELRLMERMLADRGVAAPSPAPTHSSH